MGLLASLRSPVSAVSDVWRADHPWASFYDFVVERERLAGTVWKLGVGTDIRLLYAATEEIGRQPEGATILDIPCGGGVALRGLARSQSVRYVAADISPAMLKRTKANARRRGLDQIEVVEADVEALPFGDGEFDLIATFTGLHCFPRPARAVEELARVLAPGGVITGSLLLTDTGLRHEPVRRLGRLGGLLGPSGSRAEVKRWLADAGLIEVELTSSGAIGYFRARRPSRSRYLDD